LTSKLTPPRNTIVVMSRLNIIPSPTAEVSLTPYDGVAFPKFHQVFDLHSQSSPLIHLAPDPEEASIALVLENRSPKEITALSYRWVTTDQLGESHTQTCSSDSYLVDVHRAIAEPGSRHLITPSGMLDEALIGHVLGGGGLIGIGIRVKSRPLDKIAETTFEIDTILFADGEVSGADPNRYVMELQCRKPAAEFVAKQIRRARDEDRDVEPVLAALAEIPCLGRLGKAQGDPRVLWTRHYAQDYLRHMNRKTSGVDWAEARLRHLENRPTPPKFYRRPQ
jgi:hypothetical protein